MERVKSSDVLDVTHVAKRRFRGTPIGYFRRVGPNSWDDYQFVRMSSTGVAGEATAPGVDVGPRSELLEVLPTVPLQLEPNGIEVRMRSGGRVVRLRWTPDVSDLEAMGPEPEARVVRSYFLREYLAPRGDEALLGAGAVVAGKLSNT